jgi:hypothetical protein
MSEPVQLVVNGECTVLFCAVLEVVFCRGNQDFFPRKIDLDDMLSRRVKPVFFWKCDCPAKRVTMYNSLINESYFSFIS